MPPHKPLDRREPVLAELRAHTTGIDLLQALCFLACGAYNLTGRPIKADDVYPVLEETGPSAEWIRTTLEALAEDRGNLRGSRIGMALLSALARQLPEGELLPDGYDDLLFLTPTHATSVVMKRLSQERRDALAVRWLQSDLHHPLGVGHWSLTALMELDDELVSASAVAGLAIQTADRLVEQKGNLHIPQLDPEAVDELRERVIVRYGPKD